MSHSLVVPSVLKQIPYFSYLVQADEDLLKTYRKVLIGAQVFTGLLTAAAGSFCVWTTANMKEGEVPSPLSRTGAVVSALATGIFGFGCTQASSEIEYIDLILGAENCSFERLYDNGVMDRLPVGALREKFKKMMEDRCHGAALYQFVAVVQKFDLPRLLREGIATIADCQHETYEINLAKVKPDDLDSLFPLRNQVFSDQAQRREAERQGAAYQKLKAISDQYPDRGMFGGHFCDVQCWKDEPGKAERAAQQQNAWAEALKELHD